jgi:hypothetical protein
MAKLPKPDLPVKHQLTDKERAEFRRELNLDKVLEAVGVIFGIMASGSDPSTWR